MIDLHAAEGPQAALMAQGERPGLHSTGSKAICQRHSGSKHGTPASTGAAGADQADMTGCGGGQHAAMLAQLELQDREVRPRICLINTFP